MIFIFHPGVLDDVEKHFGFRSSLEKSEFCSPLDSWRNLCILRLEGTQVWNEDHMHLLVVRPLENTPFLFSKMYMLYIHDSELTNHHTQHLSFLHITLKPLGPFFSHQSFGGKDMNASRWGVVQILQLGQNTFHRTGTQRSRLNGGRQQTAGGWVWWGAVDEPVLGEWLALANNNWQLF